MRDIRERVGPALAGRYDLEREIGRGGMATVFLARDVRHGRRVAVKVLHPELAASLAADRFVREIAIAAELAHPHIVPVFDSGEVTGLPFYVMPYIEGETLGARMRRAPRMSVAESVQLASEVADALSYAHARGVVHRDIKPDNILLASGHALVADFGIARAIDISAGGQATSAGIIVGTPKYMSPEQATAERRIDGRADIYALGCVIYEMLTGAPPFTAETSRQILSHHSWTDAARVTTAREDVPPAVDAAIARALSKVPADRYPTADLFAAALAGNGDAGNGDAGVGVPPGRPTRRRARGRAWAGASAGALAIIVIALGVISSRRSPARPLNPGAVAIMPFRVSGDSTMEYLHEGMVDLLATKLGAVDGVRPLDPRTVLAELHRQEPDAADPSEERSAAVARALGSGRFLIGSVLASPAGVAISARLWRTDELRAPIAADVEGPADSLFALVDRLAVQLIAGHTGEPAQRLADLASASLPAVRAYLSGRAAWRGGEVATAQRHYATALELDSTFALAALGMASTGAWSQQASQSEALRRGLRTGYALRTRLSLRDRLLFEAYVHPEGPAGNSAARQLLGWQRAAEAAPMLPDAQYERGDRLYHTGALVGNPSADDQARAAFSHVLDLDASHVQAIAHLIEFAARRGDAATARRLLDRYITLGPSADALPFVAWRAAVAMRRGWPDLDAPDSRERIPQFSLNRIIGFGLLEADALAAVDSAAIELRRRVDADILPPPRIHPAQTLHSWARNRGRRAASEHALATLAAVEPFPPGASIVYFSADQAAVLDAIFWDGDAPAAEGPVARVAAAAAGPAPRAPSARAVYFSNVCVALQWHLRSAPAVWRDNAEIPRLESSLRASLGADEPARLFGSGGGLCLLMVDAIRAAATDRARATTAVARLDSALVDAPYEFGIDFGNLVLARIQRHLGDFGAAQRTIHRRPYDWDTGPLYLTTYLREQGRLDALGGDRDGAIAAYRRYLALRAGADPAFRAVDDSVRAELAALRP